MSILVSCSIIGILPTACTASVWNITPAAFANAAISSTGKIVPVSLLAHITETTAYGAPGRPGTRRDRGSPSRRRRHNEP